jgi:hypothetical protein
MMTLKVVNAVTPLVPSPGTQLVATMRKLLGVGVVAGAVYLPFSVMVPNPVSGVMTVGIVHPIGPWPTEQSVGGTVCDVVESGLHICQKTVEVEAPAAVAVNCTEVPTMTVSGDTPGPLMVIPTVVLFPPQPAANIARSMAAPNPHTFMRCIPTIFTRFFLRAGRG